LKILQAFLQRGKILEARICNRSAKADYHFGFRKLKQERIYGIVVHPNKASINLVKSIGFKCEGRLRKSTFRKQR